MSARKNTPADRQSGTQPTAPNTEQVGSTITALENAETRALAPTSHEVRATLTAIGTSSLRDLLSAAFGSEQRGGSIAAGALDTLANELGIIADLICDFPDKETLAECHDAAESLGFRLYELVRRAQASAKLDSRMRAAERAVGQ